FYCIYYSLFNWDGFSPNIDFHGLQNYAEALIDKQFLHAVRVTILYTAITTLLINVLGLLFATLLNQSGLITRFYRSVFFFPMLLSSVVVGFLWQTILNYNGILNTVLNALGVNSIEFFSNGTTALLTLIGITIWHSLGFVIVIYLAGLQTVPHELTEAATIDGATRWQTYRNVTFPLIAPAFTMNMIFAITGGMKEYDKIATVTNGGPAGLTETVAFRIVKEAFVANNFGYASAMAVIMLVLVTTVSITCTMYLRRREDRLI
ncbi:MAG: sugar ABC transporter permease, partial [Gorillibacterium sp.]|nr:sugar ABC transporter permease [Gorillibacterium sp.]